MPAVRGKLTRTLPNSASHRLPPTGRAARTIRRTIRRRLIVLTGKALAHLEAAGVILHQFGSETAARAGADTLLALRPELVRSLVLHRDTVEPEGAGARALSVSVEVLGEEQRCPVECLVGFVKRSGEGLEHVRCPGRDVEDDVDIGIARALG